MFIHVIGFESAKEFCFSMNKLVGISSYGVEIWWSRGSKGGCTASKFKL